ncbi:MAG: carboxypeptidase M32 [Lachnospiraceae bacterium]|nr:carboxypeptidase M32 [Lachnospiraceae bacterium]
MSKLLEQFIAFQKERSLYEHAVALLHWDLTTHAPELGKEHTTETLAYFSTKLFSLTTSAQYGEMLEKLAGPEEYESLSEAMKVTVDRFLKEYREQARIPEDFYSELVTARAQSGQAWEKAKRASDYSIFKPHLQKMIELSRQTAAYTNPGEETYNVFLNQFEEGLDSDTVDRLFEEVKAGLAPLLKHIRNSRHPDWSIVSGDYDIDKEKKVQDLLLEYIGFDFNAGTTGESEHPFTTELSRHDSRVTNHYSPSDPIDYMFSAIHEGGHAIFQQSIDPAYENTAAAYVNMMGLHESQSRFFENILGRNVNFWIPVYDRICDLMPGLRKVPLDDFNLLINDVKPSFIRTRADEVTYCLHIILRYELETAIFRGNADVSDLPDMWNDKMEQLLGIRPENDADGILQDMHWADGMFGYFPTYLLGSIYDGMYLKAVERDLGSIDSLLAQGRVKDITAWLQTNIQQHGSLYPAPKIMERIGQGNISAAPLLDYFNSKYYKLY